MTSAKRAAGVFAFCVLGAAASSQPAVEAKPDLAGMTLDSKGEAVRKVNLLLYPLDAGPAGDPLPPYSTISDRDGKFWFYGVAPGRYRLEADHAGYLRVKFGARNVWVAGNVLTVAPGQPLLGLEVRMPEQATVAGTVTADESAATVVVALLQSRYQDGQRRLTPLATARADDQGEFSFTKVAPGRYYLAAYASPAAGSPEGMETYLTTYYPGTLDARAAEAIVLRKGEARSGLQLPLRKSPVFRVGGSVAGYASLPGRVVVFLRPAGNAFQFNGGLYAVAVEGAFEFKSVLPGSYWLTVQGASPSLTVAPQAVEVSASDITAALLKVEPPVKLAGSVKVEGGPAIAGLFVRLVPSSPFGQTPPAAEVKSDASFTFSAPPGRYRLEFQGLPDKAFVKSAVLGDQDALSGLDLSQAAADSKIAIVISHTGARVSGTVHDDKGQSVDATVTLIPEPPRPGEPSLYRVIESDNGRFRFDGIRPGKYRLYAWEELEPGAQMDPEFMAPHLAGSMTIEIGENERREVEIERIGSVPF